MAFKEFDSLDVLTEEEWQSLVFYMNIKVNMIYYNNRLKIYILILILNIIILLMYT